MRKILPLLTIAVLALSLPSPAAGASFCVKKDFVVCDSEAVRTLERLAVGADTSFLGDIYVLFAHDAGPLERMGAARILARVMAENGDRDAAIDLLTNAQRAVFVSSDWRENTDAVVGLAEQRHALGDQAAPEFLRTLTISWWEHHGFYERSDIVSRLAKGLFAIGDVDGARDRFKEARQLALGAPLEMPPDQYGDRIESLANLWIATDHRALDDLSTVLSKDIVELLERSVRYRAGRGTWPVSLEDFRLGPAGSRIGPK
jgi:hypothetical protein